jgi:hypothetical protein
MINASFQIQILPSIFFFLARPFIKRAMAPPCSVVELLKDFRRRYRRRESEGRIEFHPDIERAFGGDNPAFRDPFVLNAMDRKDQLAFIDYGSLLKTAAFRRSGQREDCAPDLRDAKPDIAPRRAASVDVTFASFFAFLWSKKLISASKQLAPPCTGNGYSLYWDSASCAQIQLPLTLITAAPGAASCFNALSAAFASTRSKICVRVLIGISAATRKKSNPSCRVLLVTLRTTRS